MCWVRQLEDAERNLENIRNVFISLLEQLQAAEVRALRMLPYQIFRARIRIRQDTRSLPLSI